MTFYNTTKRTEICKGSKEGRIGRHVPRKIFSRILTRSTSFIAMIFFSEICLELLKTMVLDVFSLLP